MMPEAAVLARLIDRACQLAEEAVGHAVDRRQVAESLMAWLRVLGSRMGS